MGENSTMRARRRTCTAVLALALGTTLASTTTGTMPAAEATTSTDPVVFVAPDGDDDNPGTRAEPLATITAARDALAGRTRDEDARAVWLRGGGPIRTGLSTQN